MNGGTLLLSDRQRKGYNNGENVPENGGTCSSTKKPSSGEPSPVVVQPDVSATSNTSAMTNESSLFSSSSCGQETNGHRRTIISASMTARRAAVVVGYVNKKNSGEIHHENGAERGDLPDTEQERNQELLDDEDQHHRDSSCCSRFEAQHKDDECNEDQVNKQEQAPHDSVEKRQDSLQPHQDGSLYPKLPFMERTGDRPSKNSVALAAFQQSHRAKMQEWKQDSSNKQQQHHEDKHNFQPSTADPCRSKDTVSQSLRTKALSLKPPPPPPPPQSNLDANSYNNNPTQCSDHSNATASKNNRGTTNTNISLDQQQQKQEEPSIFELFEQRRQAKRRQSMESSMSISYPNMRVAGSFSAAALNLSSSARNLATTDTATAMNSSSSNNHYPSQTAKGVSDNCPAKITQTSTKQHYSKRKHPYSSSSPRNSKGGGSTYHQQQVVRDMLQKEYAPQTLPSSENITEENDCEARISSASAFESEQLILQQQRLSAFDQARKPSFITDEDIDDSSHHQAQPPQPPIVSPPTPRKQAPPSIAESPPTPSSQFRNNYINNNNRATPPNRVASASASRRRQLMADSASKRRDNNNNNNNGASDILPGAYQQAPGKSVQRNRAIRNSVISTHSLSAQMSMSTRTLSIHSLAGTLESEGSFSKGHQCNGNLVSSTPTNTSSRKLSWSSSKNSLEEKPYHGRRKYGNGGQNDRKLAAVEDFYEPMPDYVEPVTKPAPTQNLSVSAADNENNILGEQKDRNEDLYNRKMAANIAILHEDSESSSSSSSSSASSSDNLKCSKSARSQVKGSGGDVAKAPPKTSYSVTTPNSKSASITNPRAEPWDSKACSQNPIPTMVDRFFLRNSSVISQSRRSVVSNLTVDGVGGPSSALGRSPDLDDSDIDDDNDNGGDEEEKEEIQSLHDIIQSSEGSVVAPLNGGFARRGRSPNRTLTGTKLSSSRENSPRRHSPNRVQSAPGRQSPTAPNTRRFTIRFSAGSNHLVQNRKMSNLSEGSNEDSFSTDLSLTEFKRRVSSIGTASSSDTSTVAKQSAGRIARNLSLYMRAGALPIAATVVSNDDNELEEELREQLEKEIRQELEIEMEDFRRQLFLQVLGAAEPITADVIEAEIFAVPDPPEGTELVSSTELQQEQEQQLLSAGDYVTDLRTAQDQQERAEAAAVRSNMNRELGRMYLQMKHSRSLRLLGDCHLKDDHLDETRDDEEMMLWGGTSSRQNATRRTDSKKWNSCAAIWAVFIVAVLAGLALGVGIVFAIYEGAG